MEVRSGRLPGNPDRHGASVRVAGADMREPVRTRVAAGAGHAAGKLSRRLGLGEGVLIGGRLALAVDRGALAHLAAGRRVVIHESR